MRELHDGDEGVRAFLERRPLGYADIPADLHGKIAEARQESD